jgi:hypothetical protein
MKIKVFTAFSGYDSQCMAFQYKMAGNSIVVDTMVHCFENLFYGENESRFQQMTLF